MALVAIISTTISVIVAGNTIPHAPSHTDGKMHTATVSDLDVNGAVDSGTSGNLATVKGMVVVAHAVPGGVYAAQLEARKLIASRPTEDVHVVMAPGVHVSVCTRECEGVSQSVSLCVGLDILSLSALKTHPLV